MDLESLRTYCLSLSDATEDMPFGPETLVFRIEGKIFLLVNMESIPLRFNVKCDPTMAEELREQYSNVVPGFHMNKKHWNTIIADGSSSAALIKEWIKNSYELVAPKKKKPIAKKK